MSYKEKYVVGATVRIAPPERLRAFQRDWRFHHPLEDDQIRFASLLDTVKTVGFYYGGDVLYTLEQAPGIWHEQLLDSN